MVPNCLYERTTLTTLALNNLVLLGSAAFPDPLVRLPSLSSLTVINCVFVADNTASSSTPYAPNWVNFFASHSGLTILVIRESGLSGPLPSRLNSPLATFWVAQNSLSGTIPSSLFAGLSPSSDTAINIDVSNNKLTGSIPASLTQNLALGEARNVRIVLDSNLLSGTLPADLFSKSNLSQTSSFYISIKNNLLTGSIPDRWISFLDMNSPLTTLSILLDSNRLTGTIPSTMLYGVNANGIIALTVTLSNNYFFGNFPDSSLFAPFAYNSTTFRFLTLKIDNNRLNGTLPAVLFAAGPQSALTNFQVTATLNSLSGSLPASFLTTLPGVSNLLGLDFEKNALSGTVPSGWVIGANFTKTKTFKLNLASNRLSGTPFADLLVLPTSTSLVDASILMSGNEFSGSVPSSFCSQCALASDTTVLITLDFSSNRLDGAFPSSLLGGFNSLTSQLTVNLNLAKNSLSGAVSPIYAGTSKNISAIVDMSSNRLTGLPSDVSAGMPGSVRLFSITLDNNPIVGGFQNSIMAGCVVNSDATCSVSLVNCSLTGATEFSPPLFAASASYFLDNNMLSGSIRQSSLNWASGPRSLLISVLNNNLTFIEFPASLPSGASMTIKAANNSLKTLSFLGDVNYIRYLDISNNPTLVRTLPDVLFNASSTLSYFNASHTGLSGTMPNLLTPSAPSLATLDMSSTTAISFCNATFTSSVLTTCSLLNTTAMDCQDKYPSICFDVTVPQAPDGGCDSSTRPSPDFLCVDGIWTAPTVIATPTLTIPSGATETIVGGNVISETIVFNGLGSTLAVTGCLNNLSTIVVTFTIAELELLKKNGSLTQLLITYADYDPLCNNLNSVTITPKVSGSSCKKVKAQKTTSQGTLSGLFTVDSSGCNTWWILVSVIAGLVVLAVVIVILLAIFVPAFRHCCRPFSKRRDDPHKL